jgi:hypothetical protein
MEALPPSPKVLEIRDVAEEIDNAVSELLKEAVEDNAVSELLTEPVPVVEEDDAVSELLTEPVLVVCEKIVSAVEETVNAVEVRLVEEVESSSCWKTSWSLWRRRSRTLPATPKAPSS